MKIKNSGNHVTDRVWELMKYLEKSLKNNCEGIVLKNVADSQPVDLLNNDLLNRFVLRSLINHQKTYLNKLPWLFRLCDKIGRWY